MKGYGMKRCAVIDDYQTAASAVADWGRLAEAVDVQFFHEPFHDEDGAAKRLAGFDIVVAMRERTPFPASLLERLPQLKLLVTTGMRNRSIDIEAAHRQGIVVCGAEGAGRPTSEMTWALILTAARNLAVETAGFRRGAWQTTLGLDLHGRTLGLLGLGTVGAQVAAVAQAFGMTVVAWSRNLTAERCVALGVTRAASLQDLLATADIVSIHLVLGERTRGLVGVAELKAMKSSALLVNTSRGPIVEEAALLRALRERWIAGAALDVYDQEPLPADHPFRDLANLTATPHLGYVTEGNYRSFYGMAVEDIAAWLEGRPLRVLCP
ncbi:D-3-phosphoglycerate dehydrogenase [Hyphomicrobiales bacterium]|nr:D-3-phosphoglycerate dehydrogenase [Hyphomicrobiales bacterium]CAH1691479.1 D-3-phosphoglycerate dehydrogenase [Hyphomicrobiales bacterium]